MFPPEQVLEGNLSWMHVGFYQRPFLHILRWACGFCLSVHLYDLSHWLTCLYWTILTSLEKRQLDHGKWSFKCASVWGFWVFCWVLLHLCSSKIGAYSFLFVVSLPAFGIIVILAPYKEFWSSCSVSILLHNLNSIGCWSSLNIW